MGGSINTTNFPVVLRAYLPGNLCEQADFAQRTLRQTAGGGTLDTVELAAAPAWMKGAIGALVGAAVFVSISIMVTAGITATGVLVGASATTVAAVTALSACIGGAASTAATLVIAGSGGSWRENLANAVAGCVTGIVIALLPIKTVGQAAGNGIREALGYAPAATVGMVGVAAATSAGVGVRGITEVTNVAADASLKVE